jgi:2-dehydropantoate 2-reductase
MRLLVVGAGSTGGYFGGRLAEAGRDVTFLVRARRAAQLRETGLQIVSPHDNVTVRPRLFTAEDIGAPCDAVLLAVKAYSSMRRSPISRPRLVRRPRSSRC